jgi:23S rRNA (uracil1939-C5)-methyltransferase
VGQTISLKIHGLGSGGEGIGHFNGYVVFVDGALPGEIVKARLFQCRKRQGWAHLLTISHSSCDRIIPPCEYFGRCGGCQLMHLSYPKQLEIKRQRVVDALRRIGKIDMCEVAPCLPSPLSLGYRNKIQLPVRKEEKEVVLGLYARSSHDLIDVKSCHIHSPLGEQVYRQVRKSVQHSGIVPYDPTNGEGELRHLLIKSAVNTGEALVILVTNQESSPKLLSLAKEIISHSDAVKGVVHNMQLGRDNVILGSTYKVLEGVGSIQEHLCGLTFKVSPASFFQINPGQAERLYIQARTYAEVTGQETILDAHCGVGTLSLFFAQQVKRVIGVECVPEAIRDAQENARLNGIENVSFVCARSETLITALSNIDLVLLNPPRKGCEPSLLEGIGSLSPKRVIYISCDPATLARDLAHLCTSGYKVDAVQPYDMFPQTAHVECVVKLSV